MHFSPHLPHGTSAWILAVALVAAAAIAMIAGTDAVSVIDDLSAAASDPAVAAPPDFLAAGQGEWERLTGARGR
ncbi:hypothetical protein [Ramlibacter algicola]|uniref:Uncharacterized protein n=1 Tax=Ramlibacter algicola TaxID=2795217 RepID=A0A934Q4K9_9BURK|nr:hypothetical protein [Ramlibacter algicola]MBK0394803.1 hypothetical protein [Ramlibacter algicola]